MAQERTEAAHAGQREAAGGETPPQPLIPPEALLEPGEHAVSDRYVARRVAEHLTAAAEANRRELEQQRAAGAPVSQGHFGFYILLGVVMASLLLAVIYAATARRPEPLVPHLGRPAAVSPGPAPGSTPEPPARALPPHPSAVPLGSSPARAR